MRLLNIICAVQLEDVQKRAEAAEAALQEERSTHKRMLRHKNRELAEAQVSALGHSAHAACAASSAICAFQSFRGTLQL